MVFGISVDILLDTMNGYSRAAEGVDGKRLRSLVDIQSLRGLLWLEYLLWRQGPIYSLNMHRWDEQAMEADQACQLLLMMAQRLRV